MKTRQYAFYLCCLLFWVMGCKKDDVRPPCDTDPYYTPVHADLHRFIFGDSSQWIYARALDGLKDTVDLLSSSRSVRKWQTTGGTGNMLGGCVTQYYEEELYGLHFRSSLEGSYWETYLKDEVGRGGNPPGLAYWAGNVGQSRSSTEIQAVHDSLVIGANTFRNVIQVQTGIGTMAEPGTWRFFLCPYIGIVRKDVMWDPDSIYNSYELIEWRVRPHP